MLPEPACERLYPQLDLAPLPLGEALYVSDGSLTDDGALGFWKDLEALAGRLEHTPVPDASAIADAANRGLPDKDAPILAAAGAAQVDILVTGDRTHFGKLYGQRIGRRRILALKDALASLLDVQWGPQ